MSFVKMCLFFLLLWSSLATAADLFDGLGGEDSSLDCSRVAMGISTPLKLRAKLSEVIVMKETRLGFSLPERYVEWAEAIHASLRPQDRKAFALQIEALAARFLTELDLATNHLGDEYLVKDGAVGIFSLPEERGHSIIFQAFLSLRPELYALVLDYYKKGAITGSLPASIALDIRYYLE